VFLSALTILFGFVGLWVGIKSRRAQRRTRGWPTVPGKILERSVGPSIGRGRAHALRITYAYSVGGTEYRGERVHPVGEVGYLDPEKKLASLPNPIPVHYDPIHPASAYLFPMPAVTVWLALVFGTAAVLIGILKILVEVASG
jgi:hypothetical protein